MVYSSYSVAYSFYIAVAHSSCSVAYSFGIAVTDSFYSIQSRSFFSGVDPFQLWLLFRRGFFSGVASFVAS